MAKVMSLASKVASLPGLSLVSPPATRAPALEDLAGYLESQRLAIAAAKAVAGLLTEGMSERQAADLLNTWLGDHGVRSYFHRAFVWYGERTRFAGVKTYFDYLPSKRVLRPNEAYILDVAPIHRGYICDIGYSGVLGQNAEWDKAQHFLRDLRREIPNLFVGNNTGGQIWEAIDRRIVDAGYDNVHSMYPFSVLGHRVHKVRAPMPRLNFINFGMQSYWEFLSRGIFGQLLNGDHRGSLTGLWAIEPHIGTKEFGAKFEEILVVDGAGARWLDESQAI
jgi:Xaa-Pro aminopeptidase